LCYQRINHLCHELLLRLGQLINRFDLPLPSRSGSAFAATSAWRQTDGNPPLKKPVLK
jgi:hypothetical protein